MSRRPRLVTENDARLVLTVEGARRRPVIGLVEACAAWGISENRAYELAGKGELPFKALRVGNRWRVRAIDLLASLGLAGDVQTREGGGDGPAAPATRAG